MNERLFRHRMSMTPLDLKTDILMIIRLTMYFSAGVGGIGPPG